MKAPDKIYVREFVEGLNPMWSSIIATETSAIAQHEYIRKDARIEWLENKIKVPDVSFVSGLTYLAYQDVIEHLNEM